jgi:hypothetical protein
MGASRSDVGVKLMGELEGKKSQKLVLLRRLIARLA